MCNTKPVSAQSCFLGSREQKRQTKQVQGGREIAIWEIKHRHTQGVLWSLDRLRDGSRWCKTKHTLTKRMSLRNHFHVSTKLLDVIDTWCTNTLGAQVDGDNITSLVSKAASVGYQLKQETRSRYTPAGLGAHTPKLTHDWWRSE